VPAGDDTLLVGATCARVPGVDPLKPIVERSPATHIAPIVRPLSRRGVSQPKL
jgi:hypothetical protein